MIVTRQYNWLNRLMNINSQPSGAGALPASYTYTYNQVNQRTRDTMADGSFWVYAYDQLGQVISGKRYWSDGTPVAGQQFEYGFDDIGNRSSAKSGGDQNGANLRSASYNNNTLNQLTGRGVPSQFDVVGAATNTVSINGTNAAYRRGEYFQHTVGSSVSIHNIIL